MQTLNASSRRLIFLILTLVGCWTFYMFAGGLPWALKQPGRLSYIIEYTLTDGILGLAVCVLLFMIYNRMRNRFGLGTFVLALVPLCFASGVLWHGVSGFVLWGFGFHKQTGFEVTNLLVGGGLRDGITLAFFLLLFFAVDHWLQEREQRLMALKASALAHQTQLQMLRYQLNPHFLFNSLNSIRAMILQEPERARQIVTELSEFLRYSLNGSGHESTVREEMQAIENYIAIQRIRFDEKLVVSVQTDPALNAITLPCFLVHPLVENAVKYGMETSEPPLRIEIELVARGTDLHIRVSNTGRIVPSASQANGVVRDGTGIGMKNVSQRLALAYPGRHTFSMQERDGWVHVEILLQAAVREVVP